MDNLINTFYIGNTNRFGFGTYNASSNNIENNINLRLPPISANNH